MTRAETPDGGAAQRSARAHRPSTLLDPAGHFEALVSSSHDAILSKALDGTITSWNGAAARLYGYSSDEAIGSPIGLIIPAERAGEEEEILSRVVAGEQLERLETDRIRKDGRVVHVSLTISPVIGPAGAIAGASIIARDITWRRRREEYADRLRQVATALSEALAPERVVEVVLEQALPTVRADAAAVALLSADGTELELPASTGYTAARLDPWRRMAVDLPLPLTDAVRRKEAVWSESAESLIRDYPALADTEIGFPALAAVPLVAEGKAVGAISLSYKEAHEFGLEERSFLRSVAHEAAQALARARLYDRERRARRDAEAARELLDFLARAGEVLADSLDQNTTLRRVADLAVPRIADWCGVDLLEDGRIENVAVAHVDPAKVELAHEFRRRYPPPLDDPTGLPNVLRTGQSELYPHVDDEMLSQAARDDEHLEMIRALSLRSVMIVALRARGRTLGAVTFVSAESGRHYDESDLAFAEELARRAALAIDNARLYRHEQGVAESLQNSLLPERLPELPGVSLAARYLSGTEGVDVGGDWYDVVALDGQRIALVIGDVAGRGIPAASVMGQLRIALRAYALEGHSPVEIVNRVNRLANTLPNGDMATLSLVVFDATGETIESVSAGHPPAVIRRANGRSETLPAARRQPIGVMTAPRYEARVDPLEPGATLVLYTDGLVERRGESLDTGLGRLRDAVADGPADAEALCDHLIDRLVEGEERPDDIAMLVLSTAASYDRLRLSLAAEAKSVPAARQAVLRLLNRAGAAPDESFAIGVAVSEATANVVEHAYGPGDATFLIEASLEGGVARISVRDFGRWRDPRGEHRGRGTSLMSACMDSVERSTDSEGTIVTMARALRREEAA